MLNIAVVLGSIRPTRKSIWPAKLMVEKLTAAGAQSQLVDFIELPLPLLNSEKETGEYEKQYPDANVQKWSAIADAADGFVLVTPEYNYSFSPAIKNALDWLYPEFKYKAFGFVGVSTGPVGGARAISQLRNVIGSFNAFDIRETVLFAKVKEAFDEQGKFLDESYNKKIDGFIKSLLFAAEVMKAAREKK